MTLLVATMLLIFVIFGGIVFQYSETFIRFLAILLVLLMLYVLHYLNGVLNAAS